MEPPYVSYFGFKLFSFCFSFLSARITGVHQHTWPYVSSYLNFCSKFFLPSKLHPSVLCTSLFCCHVYLVILLSYSSFFNIPAVYRIVSEFLHCRMHKALCNLLSSDCPILVPAVSNSLCKSQENLSNSRLFSIF
jgi:hypothetical protein